MRLLYEGSGRVTAVPSQEALRLMLQAAGRTLVGARIAADMEETEKLPEVASGGSYL